MGYKQFSVNTALAINTVTLESVTVSPNSTEIEL